MIFKAIKLSRLVLEIWEAFISFKFKKQLLIVLDFLIVLIKIIVFIVKKYLL